MPIDFDVDFTEMDAEKYRLLALVHRCYGDYYGLTGDMRMRAFHNEKAFQAICRFNGLKQVSEKFERIL